ncbi:hypothetical protein LIER_31269 [Lithospermum erythrorhizon]|uniref:Uncharacterized protein n=1 Tax=Lithospermum erythrorhizon TaxID=34254 RepID=A0AAV3RSG4_LITER
MGISTATSFLLLLLTSFPAIESLSFWQYHSLISLSQSLTSRVANLRASRGDHAGAARASIGYDYLKNYAWRTDASEMLELKELISSRNHQKLISLSRGPLKEVLEALHKEVVDGELLKDCLHLGNNDFIAALQLLKDISTQYYQPSSSTDL